MVLAPGGAHLARPVARARPEVDERVSAQESASRDAVSVNMFKLHERYSEEPRSHAAGNTVRSFKAVPSESLIRAFISVGPAYLCSFCELD